MNNGNSETTKNISNKGAFRVMLAGLLVMLGVALLCGAYFLLMMHRVSPADDSVYNVYSSHYAFITDDTERELWDEVYGAAQKEAETKNIYVERVGDNLNKDYSTKDLLRVAVNSSVDGIIYCGQDDEETVDLINQAAQKGIAVVCLRRDIDDSARQCFVGVNSYDLGLEYGKLIQELISLGQLNYDGFVYNELEQSWTVANSEHGYRPQIYILVDNIAAESMQNLITLAIRDSFSKSPRAELSEIELIKIDTEDTFSAEETIRDIFIDKQNLPDIIVCLNSIYTQSTYQAAVDHNRVGDVKILGYYSTDEILDAIEKQIIYATVEVDTEEMGIQSVRALAEYEETGYTSSYIPIRTWVVRRQDAEKILQEAKEDAAD